MCPSNANYRAEVGLKDMRAEWEIAVVKPLSAPILPVTFPFRPLDTTKVSFIANIQAATHNQSKNY